MGKKVFRWEREDECFQNGSKILLVDFYCVGEMLRAEAIVKHFALWTAVHISVYVEMFIYFFEFSFK